ncbi:MAG: hypothetical protein ACR2L2_19890 [Acidobacteriota bacterium]
MRHAIPACVVLLLVLALSTSLQQSTPSRGGVAVFPFQPFEEGVSSGRKSEAAQAGRQVVADLQQRGLRAELLPWPAADSAGRGNRANLGVLLGAARLRDFSAIALVGYGGAASGSETADNDGDNDAQGRSPVPTPNLARLSEVAGRLLSPGTDSLIFEGGLIETSSARVLCKLESATARDIAGQIAAGTSGMLVPATVRRVAGGVGFARLSYHFQIDRDYDQRVEVEVVNSTNTRQRVRAGIGAQDPDLVLGFLGAGSTAGPAILEPGQLQRLRLVAGAPAAQASNYQFVIQLKNLDSGAVLDTVPVTLQLKQRRLQLQVEEARVAPAFSVRNYRVVNLGDEVTDLSATLGRGLAPLARISPSVRQTRLAPRQGLDVQIHLLAAAASSVDGDVVFEGNGGQIRVPVRFDATSLPGHNDADNPEAYQLYRSEAEFCSNKGEAEVELDGPSLAAGSEAPVYLQMRFTLRHDRATLANHDTLIELNGQEVGRLSRRIPEGTYLFPVAPHLLDRRGHNRVRMKILGMNGASYSVVSSVRLLAPADSWGRRAAGRAGSRSLKELNIDRPDIGVFANSIGALTAAPIDGETLQIRLLVKNLGRQLAPAGLLRLYNQDPRPLSAGNPLELLRRMQMNLGNRLLELQRVGSDISYPALAPGQQTEVTVRARYVSAVSTRFFIVAEAGENDFDPDNNIQTMTFGTPETLSPLLGTDLPNLFGAPSLGRILRLPDRQDYRAQWERRLRELAGNGLNLRLVFP